MGQQGKTIIAEKVVKHAPAQHNKIMVTTILTVPILVRVCNGMVLENRRLERRLANG